MISPANLALQVSAHTRALREFLVRALPGFAFAYSGAYSQLHTRMGGAGASADAAALAGAAAGEGR